MFKFRRANVWLHTALQKSSRLKKKKIFVAQLNAVSHHELAVLNSEHAFHQNLASGILTKTHALPPTIIPEFKQSKNDQKSLCVNKRLTPPTINCKLKEPTT